VLNEELRHVLVASRSWKDKKENKSSRTFRPNTTGEFTQNFEKKTRNKYGLQMPRHIWDDVITI
jgi:hypothetical protein